MIDASPSVTVSIETVILPVVLALLGLAGYAIVAWGNRKTAAVNVRGDWDKRIDSRIDKQMEKDEKRLAELESKLEELETHSGEQDRQISDLQERDRRKSSIFQRIFTTLASLLPEGVAPHLELTTTEIALVGDTLPRDWIKQHKENP